MGHLSDWLITLELSDISDFASIITALAAIYIANKAMKISKEQGEVARLHNLLTVRPFLRGIFSESEYSCDYVIKNVGTGPALIKSYQFLYREEVISRKDLSDIIKCLTKNSADIQRTLQSLTSNSALAINEEIVPIALSFNAAKVTDSGQVANVFNLVKQDLYNNLKLEIFYTSLQEEKVFKYATPLVAERP